MSKKVYYINTIEDVESLSEQLSDINEPINKNGATLLHLCCIMSNDSEPVEYLLDKGANPNQTDKFKLTPIDYAMRNPNQLARVFILSLLK